ALAARSAALAKRELHPEVRADSRQLELVRDGPKPRSFIQRASGCPDVAPDAARALRAGMVEEGPQDRCSRAAPSCRRLGGHAAHPPCPAPPGIRCAEARRDQLVIIERPDGVGAVSLGC